MYLAINFSFEISLFCSFVLVPGPHPAPSFANYCSAMLFYPPPFISVVLGKCFRVQLSAMRLIRNFFFRPVVSGRTEQSFITDWSIRGTLNCHLWTFSFSKSRRSDADTSLPKFIFLGVRGEGSCNWLSVSCLAARTGRGHRLFAVTHHGDN